MQRQPLGFYQDNNLHPPLKVSVFSRLHQLQGIVEQLQRVANLPLSEKQTWLEEHQDTTLTMFREFQEYIKLDFEQDDVDQEMLSLLTEYSRSLQECAAYIHSLFPEARLQG
jgi:hypothetical protein